MTARDVWEAVLVELNKVQAPTLLIEDFNYLCNKAINQYVNKRYTMYDVSQQLTDDLRTLKSTIHLTPSVCQISGQTEDQIAAIKALYGATFEVFLPLDYRHLLNCLCSFKRLNLATTSVCGGGSDSELYVNYPATRLSSDLWPTVVNNYYNRPSYKKPYYYIHTNNSNMGTASDTDIDYISDTENALKSLTKSDANLNPTYSRTITLGGGTSLVGDVRTEIGNKIIQNGELQSVERVGNPSKTRLEIRYGKDANNYELVDVQIDYLRTPQFIQLTQEQLDLIQDTSQILEWPDYVCNEIINELVHLIMENSADQRLQTHTAMTTSIA